MKTLEIITTDGMPVLLNHDKIISVEGKGELGCVIIMDNGLCYTTASTYHDITRQHRWNWDENYP